MSDNNYTPVPIGHTRIEAKLLRETDAAYLMDCEGDEVWFPKAQVSYNSDSNSLDIPNWLYNVKFPNG